jgi:hypothetical protein
MTNRKSIYVKINNTLVDISQIAGIECGFAITQNPITSKPVIRMYSSVSNSPLFTFMFNDEEKRNKVMGDIYNTIERITGESIDFLTP